MRKILCILSCLLVAGCTSFDRNPYDGALRELRVTAVYPEGYAGYLREGVAVKLSDRNTGNVYTALTDAQGHAGFRVAAGHYRLSVLDLPDVRRYSTVRSSRSTLSARTRKSTWR